MSKKLNRKQKSNLQKVYAEIQKDNLDGYYGSIDLELVMRRNLGSDWRNTI